MNVQATPTIAMPMLSVPTQMDCLIVSVTKGILVMRQVVLVSSQFAKKFM